MHNKPFADSAEVIQIVKWIHLWPLKLFLFRKRNGVPSYYPSWQAFGSDIGAQVEEEINGMLHRFFSFLHWAVVSREDIEYPLLPSSPFEHWVCVQYFLGIFLGHELLRV